MSLTQQEREAARAIFGRIADVGGAFASPARLMVMVLVSQKERSVEEIARLTGLSVANASQHLQKLARSGFLKVRRDGVSRLYRMDDPSLARLLDALQDFAERIDPGIARLEQEAYSDAPHTTESPVSILRRVKQRRAVLLDVRPLEESEETPIPSALAIPHHALSKNLGKLSRKHPIFVLCRGRFCPESAMAVRTLRGKGFDAYRIPSSPNRFRS